MRVATYDTKPFNLFTSENTGTDRDYYWRLVYSECWPNPF